MATRGQLTVPTISNKESGDRVSPGLINLVAHQCLLQYSLRLVPSWPQDGCHYSSITPLGTKAKRQKRECFFLASMKTQTSPSPNDFL